jgi:hypothetical protein
METVLLIFAAVFIIFLYILITPMSLSLSYETRYRRIITSIKFPLFHFKKVSDKEKKKPKGRKKETKTRITFQLLRQLLRDEFDTVSTVLAECAKFCGYLLKSPDRYHVNISLKGSPGPPDLAGAVYGAVELLRPVLGKSFTIQYQPDFTAESIEGNVSVGLEVRAIKIVKEIWICFWKLPKVKLIKIIRILRKGGKDVKQD